MIRQYSELMKKGLDVTYLWHDSDVREVRVSAENAEFRGSADTYIGTGTLAEFVTTLSGFPQSSLDKREVIFGAFGHGTAGGAAKLEFYCKDQAGHTVLRATIQSDRGTQDVLESATIYVDFEPAALDVFLAELEQVETEHHGSATLWITP